MTTYEQNPAWTVRVLRDHWSRILEHVPPAWMPVNTPLKRWHFQEYGCGHYGCVMPTSDPDVVCKVTTDVTEAGFVAIAKTLDYYPSGLVQYHKVLALPGTTHRNRPLFILWRATAYDVGALKCHGVSHPSKFREALTPDEYQAAERRYWDEHNQVVFCRYLTLFNAFAGVARDSLKKNFSLAIAAKNYEDWAWDISAEWGDAELLPRYGEPSTAFKRLRTYRGAQRVGLALRGAELLTEHMQNSAASYLVGEALRFYFMRGILLADVHINNIGKAPVEDHRDREWVITDPGHAVVLDDRYVGVSIQQI